ncbi:MAG: hypothetical protein H7321_06165 [Bacteroidia bacterium]|nr:hypothetical protein [Bacteroidia bacterium]
MSFQCTLQLGIITWFSVNRASIAEQYCVNKDKPELCCKGKCFLDKQLQKAENNNNVTKSFSEQDIPFFIVPEKNLQQTEFVFINNIPVHVFPLSSSGFNGDIFNPPKSLVSC